MPLFQKSVTNKYLKNLDTDKVNKAFENFQKFYGNKLRLANIMQLKEENYQEGFLREIFVETLGYIINPDENYNLTTEFKNQKDARKADGAIVRNTTMGQVPLAVIELKSTKTKNLESIKEQAFGYKNNQPDCKYVITSNFQSLRFYVDNATEYEEFNLFQINKEQFKLLYLLLSKESIFSDLPEKLKQETKFHENNISTQLYADYKHFKDKIFENLVKNNPEHDKLTLFKKSQKLLDRFLFIFFAEDSGLIPPNAVSKIVEQWKDLQELDEYKPLYSRFQKLFSHLDKGHVYKKWGEIPAYNGGLFRNDEILDSADVKIDDEILEKDSLKLSKYDFNTEVDVNILGHIFEHSLNEIEEIEAELSATAATRGHVPLSIPKSVSKRKKDGVFYTPKYITKYIVENTVGTLCNEKKEELQINNLLIDENYRKKDGKVNEKGKKLFKTLNAYKDWLITLKILDPACGSGAFLNQTLDFLIAEHKQTDDLIAELTGEALRLHDTDKSILENNIYGVDINEESVEIAKLSLWLRTAQRGRPLSDLSGNIKCGNSLIDAPEVAGDKAFNWNTEFPQIFKEKEKTAWHITTATHNSRYSQRMFDNHVKLDDAIWLMDEDEILITETIAKIVKEDNLNITAYNICGDHVHLLLVCNEKERDRIVGKLKAVSGRKYNIEKGITVPTTATTTLRTRGHVPLSDSDTYSYIDSDTDTYSYTDRDTDTYSYTDSDTETDTTTKKEKKKYNSLWTQKYGKKRISDNEQYSNTLKYIQNNKTKHELPENPKLQKIIDSFVCSTEHAFRPEYKGGFDVVIGNPPYGAKISKEQQKYLNFKYIQGGGETVISFLKLSENLLAINGRLGFIIPKSFSYASNYKYIRSFLKDNISEIVDCKKVWQDVKLEQVIVQFTKNKIQSAYFTSILRNSEVIKIGKINKETFEKYGFFLNGISNKELAIADNLTKDNCFLNDIAKNSRGGIFQKYISKDGDFEVLGGAEIQRTGVVGIKGKVKKEFVVNDNKTQIAHNSVLVQNIVAHIENPIDHIKITACLPEKLTYRIVDTINQIYVNENYSNKLIWIILNSKLINWYAYRFIYGKAIRTMHFDSPVTSRIPIKEISSEAQQPFIEKADLMLSLNKELQTKAEKFLKRIKSNLEIGKITNKLNSFYDFDFKTFLKEINKQRKSANKGTRPLALRPLGLREQDEWEDYFDTYKTEINNIQNQIKQTDKEIDKMVYDLYELTAEEIEIVENSVN